MIVRRPASRCWSGITPPLRLNSPRPADFRVLALGFGLPVSALPVLQPLRLVLEDPAVIVLFLETLCRVFVDDHRALRVQLESRSRHHAGDGALHRLSDH